MQNQNENRFLVEYQAAQDSAQHHDDQIWSATGVIWASNLILLGFILSSLSQPGVLPLVIVLGLLGLVLNTFLLIASLQYTSVKNQKYKRCRELEEVFDFHQHRDLRYRQRTQTYLYVGVMLLFFAAWITVLLTALGALWALP